MVSVRLGCQSLNVSRRQLGRFINLLGVISGWILVGDQAVGPVTHRLSTLHDDDCFPRDADIGPTNSNELCEQSRNKKSQVSWGVVTAFDLYSTPRVSHSRARGRISWWSPPWLDDERSTRPSSSTRRTKLFSLATPMVNTTLAISSPSIPSYASDSLPSQGSRQSNKRNKKKDDNSVQLQWLVNNIEKNFLGNHECSQEVWHVVQQLLVVHQKHPQRNGNVNDDDNNNDSSLEQMGELLAELNVTEDCSPAVQERLIKAAALAGFWPIALQWTYDLFLEQSILPGDMAQNELCTQLRQARRYTELRDLVETMGRIQKLQQQSMSSNAVLNMSAFNLYLASLTDQALEYRPYENEQQNDVWLQQAWEWIGPLDKARQKWGVVPDAVSYATVLEAAAQVGNRTLSNLIWQFVQDNKNLQHDNTTSIRHNGVPIGTESILNVNAYNARLKTLVLGSGPRMKGRQTQGNPKHSISSDWGEPVVNHNQQEDDTLALQLWQEMEQDPYVQPDQYTIDLMLLPWIRQGQGQLQSWKTIQSSVNEFFARQCPSTLIASQALSAFLLRLCEDGTSSALWTARTMFQEYIGIPWFGNNADTPTQSMPLSFPMPQTRHFNILLKGYRKALRNNLNARQDTDSIHVREEAWKLFSIMQTSSLVVPDPITVTTMMGLCRSSKDLCRLLMQSTSSQSQGGGGKRRKDNKDWLKTKPIILRAAITRFGELGDVSSACWLFDRYGSFHSQQLRLWNVLLGAIVKASLVVQDSSSHDIRFKQSHMTTINVSIAEVSSYLMGGKNIQENALQPGSVAKELCGCTFPEAATKLLSFMNNQSPCMSQYGVSEKLLPAPQPDSQSYCLVASALQPQSYKKSVETDTLIQMFRQALAQGIAMDGRFLNALVRCFGDNIQAALNVWKQEIRPACFTARHELGDTASISEHNSNLHLAAAYHGLLYCAGRAWRPDLAVRIVYAMRKEGLEPNEVSLHSYLAGKQQRPDQDEVQLNRTPRSSRGQQNQPAGKQDEPKSSFLGKVANIGRRRPWGLVACPYEALLQVECTQYDPSDRRRFQNEARVRIIV